MSIFETASEGVTQRALDAIINFIAHPIKSLGEKSAVVFGDAFRRYLDNAQESYNCIRTPATGPEIHVILGENSLYEYPSVRFQGRDVDTYTAESLLSGIDEIRRKSKSEEAGTRWLLIQARGGMGKTMLMRFLFLVTARNGGYVPILLNLRRIRGQSEGAVSIPELVCEDLRKMDAEFSDEQFLFSLRFGKYLFLLDGLDEVPAVLSRETAEAIQQFCAAYPENLCIVTSRPEVDIAPLQSFEVAEISPFHMKEAISLSERLAQTRENTPEAPRAQEFYRRMRDHFYQQPREFTENPLLLSMMFLTFVETGAMPQDTGNFYEQTFDALYKANYQAANVRNRGTNPREFQCAGLTKRDFRRTFARFCFQSYMRGALSFKEEELLAYLQDSLEKLGYDEKAESFFRDLLDVLCLIIWDGEDYRFTHRSFQEYFSAYYTRYELTDEQQRHLFRDLLSRKEAARWDEYFKILMRMDETRFTVNALEEVLRKVQAETDRSDCPNLCFLRMLAPCGGGYASAHNGAYIEMSMRFLPSDETLYDFNVVRIFAESKFPDLFGTRYSGDTNHGFLRSKAPYTEENGGYQNLLGSLFYSCSINYGSHTSFYEIPTLALTDAYWKSYEKDLGGYFMVDKVRAEIRKALAALDAREPSPDVPDFLQDL